MCLIPYNSARYIVPSEGRIESFLISGHQRKSAVKRSCFSISGLSGNQWVKPISMQRLAGSFKDLGYSAVADSIDNETFLIEAVLAEEQFGESVAIYVHRIDQFQAW